MKNKLLLLSLLFLFTLSVQAQINNEAGTVYLRNAHEISGTISYFADDENNVIVYDKDGVKINFTPEQIQEIKLNNGKRFFTKTYQDKKKERHLLLQAILLSDGKISLFKHDGSIPDFYVTKGNELYLLENNELIYEGKSSFYKNYDYKYIATLSMLMQDRFDLVQKLHKIKFDEYDFIEIITEYAGGEVNYYMTSGIRDKGAPYWLAFSQYSNFATLYMQETVKHSFGMLLGFQYHFSKTGRGSLKVSLDRSFYKLAESNENLLSLSTRYQYEIIQREKFNFYFNVQLLNLTWYNTEDFETGESNVFLPSLSLSPNLGFEFKPTQRLFLFYELNHAFHINQYPKNYSLGLKYSFLK